MEEDLKPSDSYLDQIGWTFIWTEFSGKDYITGYAEDTWYSTFEYAHNGFYDKASSLVIRISR